MMPVTKTYTDAAAQVPIALDYLPVSDITVVTSLISGTLTAPLVQVTLDEVHDEQSPQYVVPASARWVTLVGITIPTAAGAAYVTVPGPWRAIRMNTVGGVSTPVLVFQVAQSTTPRA